jgi:hypothetical protein
MGGGDVVAGYRTEHESLIPGESAERVEDHDSLGPRGQVSDRVEDRRGVEEERGDELPELGDVAQAEEQRARMSEMPSTDEQFEQQRRSQSQSSWA